MTEKNIDRHLFIFEIFSIIWKFVKASKTLFVVPLSDPKTSPSKKLGFYSLNVRIRQDPESGMVNDLKGRL